jgi:hypothetical protein
MSTGTKQMNFEKKYSISKKKKKNGKNDKK